MSESNHSTVVKHVKKWLDDVVIEHNFCPFAAYPRINNRIRFALPQGADMSGVLSSLKSEFERLDENSDTSTTLLILPVGWESFDNYLLLVDMAQQSLAHWQYTGTYQLASFHPDYLFAGEPLDSASHYTNRAPYPILHIIREAEIEQVLAHHGAPEAIPTENVAKAQALGKAFLQQQLSDCKTP